MTRGGREKGNGFFTAVRLTLDELFDHPPVNEAELKQRLKRLRRATVRQELVDRMERGELEEANEPLVLALFRLLGPGEQQQRLVQMATDRESTPRTRFLALESLDEETKGALGEHLHEVDPEAAHAMATAPLVDLMTSVQANPAQAEMVTLVLLGTPEPERERMLHLLGQCRRTVGTPAAVAYRHALSEPDLVPYHPHMIDAIVVEGGEAGAVLLEMLRDMAEGAQRSLLQKAMLRLRTRAIDPGQAPAAPAGRAFVTSADGQGTFILVACFDNPDETATVADLCIRAGGDLRDGLVLAHVLPEEAQGFVDELARRSKLALAPLSLGEAAALSLAAVDRTRVAGLPIPLEAIPALDLVGRVRPEPAPVPDDSGTTPALAQVRRLLEQPVYSAWFFDEGDMQDALQGQPPPRQRSIAWFSKAAARLEGPGVQARLVGMALHMARWHQLLGEPGQADLCLRLARVTEDNFAHSPLVRVMLERGLKWLDETDINLEPMSFGDPRLRQRLKAAFFADVCSPKGRDLARLDLTEAAYVALDDAVLDLPGHRRPRDEQLMEMAHALGRTYVNGLLGHKPGAEVLLLRALMRVAPLGGAECEQLVGFVLPALAGFVESVCELCPVGCLGKAKRSVADAFFSPEHPAPGPLRGAPIDDHAADCSPDSTQRPVSRRGTVNDDHAK